MYFHFLWKMKIDVVTSVCTGHSNMPPACCVPMGSNPSPQQNGSLFTSVPDAPSDPWILPRAKNMLSPACFCTSVRTGAALSNPVSSSANEKDHTQRCGLFHWQRMRDSNPLKKTLFPLWRSHFFCAVAIFIAIFRFWGSAEMGGKCVLITVFVSL